MQNRGRNGQGPVWYQSGIGRGSSRAWRFDNNNNPNLNPCRFSNTSAPRGTNNPHEVWDWEGPKQHMRRVSYRAVRMAPVKLFAGAESDVGRSPWPSPRRARRDERCAMVLRLIRSAASRAPEWKCGVARAGYVMLDPFINILCLNINSPLYIVK